MGVGKFIGEVLCDLLMGTGKETTTASVLLTAGGGDSDWV